MKITDIKNGQIVETRNGNKYYRFGKLLVNDSGHLQVKSYDNNTMLMKYRASKNFDIIKVYATCESDSGMLHIAHVYSEHKTIFKRKEE